MDLNKLKKDEALKTKIIALKISEQESAFCLEHQLSYGKIFHAAMDELMKKK